MQAAEPRSSGSKGYESRPTWSGGQILARDDETAAGAALPGRNTVTGRQRLGARPARPWRCLDYSSAGRAPRRRDQPMSAKHLCSGFRSQLMALVLLALLLLVTAYLICREPVRPLSPVMILQHR